MNNVENKTILFLSIGLAILVGISLLLLMNSEQTMEIFGKKDSILPTQSIQKQGLLSGFSTNNTQANNTIGNTTFFGNYNPQNQQISISANSQNLTNVRLLTPLDNKVFRGANRLVAEFEVVTFVQNASFLENLYFQNIRSNMENISREYTFKIRELDYIQEIPIMEERCTTPGALNLSQGNKEVCVSQLKRTELKPIYKWTEMTDNLPPGTYHIGLFTDVLPNDKVEWIPYLYSFQVTAWASWTDDLTEGLYAYWTLDEDPSGPNDALDTAQNIHNITSWTDNPQNSAGAVIDDGIDLDGNDYGEIATYGGNFTTTNVFSTAGWVNFDAGATAKYNYFLGGFSSVGNLGLYYAWGGSDAGRPFYVQIRGSATCTYIGTATNLPTGSWHHVGFVFNETAGIFYVNGTRWNVHQCQTNNFNYKGQPWNFGEANKDGGARGPVIGDMDEWGWWNVTLNDTQMSALYNDGNGLTLPAGDSSPPEVVDLITYAVNGSREILGNETWFNSGNLTAIEYMRLNFTIRDATGISGDITLRYTADGKEACSLGNNQSQQCYNHTNAEPNKWIIFQNGTDTVTFKDEGASGDFIDCDYDGTATERNYTCLIDEHYNPNVLKWYNASYNFSNEKFQSGASQRITQDNQIRVHVEKGNGIPLDADQYKLDFRANYTTGALTPTQPLEAYACNSTYVSGDASTNATCALIAVKDPSEFQDDGTKFRAIFTKALVDGLGDIEHIVLRTEENNPSRYYMIKTYNATNVKHNIMWDYSTDGGDTWTQNTDGYETELNINWFYGGLSDTRIVFMIESTDTLSNTANSSTFNMTWDINTTEAFAPLVTIQTPDVGDIITKITSINWTSVDANDDTLLTNITITNQSGTTTVIASGIYDIIRNYTWDTRSHANGDYNLTVTSWENDTGNAFYDSDTHNISLNNDFVPPDVVEFLFNPATPVTYVQGASYSFEFNVSDLNPIGNVFFEFAETNYTATNLSANIYNITLFDLGVAEYIWYVWANDTDGNINNSVGGIYNVTQATGEVYTFINETRGNLAIDNNTININITGVLNVGLGNISLYINNASSANGTSPITNISNFTTGTFIMNTTYLGNQNYTWDEEIWTLTITNATGVSTATTGGAARQCRYKKFGFYNEELPWLREANCV